MKAIPILVMLALVIGAYTPAAFAATDFTMDWTGIGNSVISGTFNSGDDAKAQMWANGNTDGHFYAYDSDYEDAQHYQCGVDPSSALISGDINTGGGSLRFKYTMTDSCSQGSFGPSGQTSDSFVYSAGTGTLDFSTNSHYAYLFSGNYYNSPNNGDCLTAIGTSFDIYHTLTYGPNSGSVEVSSNYYLDAQSVPIGSGGAAVVGFQSERAGYLPSGSFIFGEVAGYGFANTDITATGSGGIARVTGHGDDYLAATNGSWTLPLGGTYTATWLYDTGLTVANYGFFGS